MSWVCPRDTYVYVVITMDMGRGSVVLFLFLLQWVGGQQQVVT